jgi:hypothetical protein
LNHITFKSIMEFDHPLKISSKDLVIFKEIDNSFKNKKDISASFINDSFNENNEQVASIYSSPSKCMQNISIFLKFSIINIILLYN